jgi:hypothetical protein
VRKLLLMLISLKRGEAVNTMHGPDFDMEITANSGERRKRRCNAARGWDCVGIGRAQ